MKRILKHAAVALALLLASLAWGQAATSSRPATQSAGGDSANVREAQRIVALEKLAPAFATGLAWLLVAGVVLLPPGKQGSVITNANKILKY